MPDCSGADRAAEVLQIVTGRTAAQEYSPNGIERSHDIVEFEDSAGGPGYEKGQRQNQIDSPVSQEGF